MLKHDRAYLSVDSESTLYNVRDMKCKTVLSGIDCDTVLNILLHP